MRGDVKSSIEYASCVGPLIWLGVRANAFAFYTGHVFTNGSPSCPSKK